MVWTIDIQSIDEGTYLINCCSSSDLIWIVAVCNNVVKQENIVVRGIMICHQSGGKWCNGINIYFLCGTFL